MSDLLGNDYPIAVQIACVQREIAMREYVYPRRVKIAKMSERKADTELACMKAVLKTLTDAEAMGTAK